MAAAEGNNGSGLGVYPVDPNQPKTEEQIRQEAWQMWDSVLTPISDEYIAGPHTPERFIEYHQRLKERYGNCKKSDYVISEWIGPVTSGPGYNHFENYKHLYQIGLKNAEKLCQLYPRLEQMLQQTYHPDKHSRGYVHEIPKTRLSELKNGVDLVGLLRNIEEQKIALKAYQNKAERRKYKTPMGNLLKLNAPPPVPNLLGFGPTQAGLNARARELQGLFGPAGAGGGGAVRHRKRKQRKTQKRKNRRNRTRKN